MRKIIIAGGRDFDDFKSMYIILNKLKWKEDDIIISGTARGADSLGERYAEIKGLSVKQFPAKWEEYGKKAGFIRNEEMAIYSTGAIIFWDGKSRGTKSMIELMKKYNKPFKIIYYKKRDI